MDQNNQQNNFLLQQNQQQTASFPENTQKQQNQEEHKLRISIDIRSIKEHEFRGQVYAKYSAIPLLNISQFRTSPVLELNNPKVEEQFKNSFKSYTFDSDMNKLYNEINNQQLEIELYHQERMKKDMLIGISRVQISDLFKAAIKKTANSFARVNDAYLPLDEVDDKMNAIGRIAELRVIMYLEDLGPVSALREKDRQLGLQEMNSNFNGFSQQKQDLNPNIVSLPSQNIDNPDDPQKQKILQEMNSLEYKIIWELETWKKAEEAKFKISLKQREIDFLNNLSQEWKQKELEKEKYFKIAEANITLIEQKLKGKASDLNKREQKIAVLEENLNLQKEETVRAIKIREDEIQQLKKKMKDDASNFEKAKTGFQLELETSKAQYKQLQSDFDLFKRDQDKSPINLIKNDIAQKISENKELQRELQKAIDVKDQYKEAYEKLRNELIRQKKNFEEIKDSAQTQNQLEIQNLKSQISTLEQKLLQSKQQENIQPNYYNPQQNQNNQGKMASNNPQQNFNYPQQQQYQQQQPQQQQSPQKNQLNLPEYQWDKKNMGALEALIQERDFLLATGDYKKNDQLIIELNNQIAELKH